MVLIRNQKINKKIDFIVLLTLIFTINLIYLPEIGALDLIKYIGVAIFIVCFLIGSFYTDLVGLVLLTPCHYIFTINEISILFVLLSIASMKLVFFSERKKYNILPFLLVIPAIIIEFVFDYLNISTGIFIRLFLSFIYSFLCMQIYDFKNFNIKQFIYIIIYSQFIPLIYTYIVGGRTIIEYISGETIIRFGEDSRNFSGAMFVPIYSMFVICLSTMALLKYKPKIYIKILLYILMAISFLFGMLTISRAFILGFAVYFVYIIILLFKSRNKKRAYIISGVTLSVLALFYAIFFKSINSIIYDYIFRTEQSATSGRTEIYLSCIKYLMKHPLNLLFGIGADYYRQLGALLSLPFEAGAHNIIIDGIMSWGIIGFSAYIVIYYIFVRKLLNENNTKFSLFSTMLPITYFIMILTSGAFYIYNTYIYIIVLILIACLFTKKENKIDISGEIQS